MNIGNVISIRRLELPSGTYPKDIGSHGVILDVFSLSIPHLEVFNKRENCYTVITNMNIYANLRENTSFVHLEVIA